jgi:hypothetical protein
MNENLLLKKLADIENSLLEEETKLLMDQLEMQKESPGKSW